MKNGFLSLFFLCFLLNSSMAQVGSVTCNCLITSCTITFDDCPHDAIGCYCWLGIAFCDCLTPDGGDSDQAYMPPEIEQAIQNTKSQLAQNNSKLSNQGIALLNQMQNLAKDGLSTEEQNRMLGLVHQFSEFLMAYPTAEQLELQLPRTAQSPFGPKG